MGAVEPVGLVVLMDGTFAPARKAERPPLEKGVDAEAERADVGANDETGVMDGHVDSHPCEHEGGNHEDVFGRARGQFARKGSTNRE